MAGKRQTDYQYVKLSEAKAGGTAKSYNVFGVVTFSKVPKKTQGTDYCMTISITDESLPQGEKIVCNLFYRSLDSFPTVSVGDVVRFHRLVVEEFHGEPKGKPGYGFSWLVVGTDVDKPLVSSQKYTYTDDNKQRVRELQDWAKGRGLVRNSSLATINSLIPRSYCDLVCQVIGTCVEEENVCFVARVWDGTRPIHPTVNTLNRLGEVDNELDRVTSEMSVDIWLYDDHFQACRRIKPGQYIKLCNLHAAVHKDATAENPDADVAFPTLELTIHRGTSYGRGVVLLLPDSAEAVDLKQRIAQVSATTSGDAGLLLQHSEGRSATVPRDGVTGISTEPQPGPSKEREGSNGQFPVISGQQQSGQSDEASSSRNGSVHAGGGDGTVSQPSSTEECMLQTASVVTGHQHITRTSLSNVMSHSVPYKFRVLASLLDFHPNVDDASKFIQYFCPKCHYLKTADSDAGGQAKAHTSSSLTSKLASFLGGHFANWNPEQVSERLDTNVCQHCTTDKDAVSLEPIYMLRLILQDNSGYLVANLWRKEAVTFFRGVKAEELLKDKGVFSDIMSTLRSLCVSQASSSAAAPPPKLDCCLYSYSGQTGINFHIFDTELV